MIDTQLDLARRTLTDKELAAFELWQKGAGYRRIADLLEISVTTARDRIRNSLRKLKEAA